MNWKRFINRASLILSLVSFGLLLCSAAVEASGYLVPMEDWLSGFFFWATVFALVYEWTKPVNPPAETPDAPLDSP